MVKDWFEKKNLIVGNHSETFTLPETKITPGNGWFEYSILEEAWISNQHS